MTEKDFWEAIGRASREEEEKTVCFALSDWLEEHGQLAKAEWIRACIKGKGFPVYDPNVAPALWFAFQEGESWWSERGARFYPWYDWRKENSLEP